jgi:aspartate/methionine/tyrosine aminotransferase
MQISARAHGITKKGIRQFSGAADGHTSIYDLSVGQPDYKVPFAMKAAAIDAINDDRNSYIPTGGERYIRDMLGAALSQAHPTLGQYKADFDVLVTSGVTGALYSSLLACCDVGDDVLLADPYFSPYRDLILLAGANPVFIDTYPDFALTESRIRCHLTRNTRVLLLNSPNNPTGRVLARSELMKILELCQDRGVRIVSDEIYSTFDYTGNFCSMGDVTRDALVLNGFAKSHGSTGWRIGFLTGPTDLIEVIERIQGKIYVSAPSIAQYSIPAALGTDTTSNSSLMRQRRNLVLEGLRGLFPQTSCDGGMFVFIDVETATGSSGTTFAEAARKAGVLILPGGAFSQHDTHCRLSLTADNATLTAALDRLEQTLVKVSI